jgi:hypothetical protein
MHEYRKDSAGMVPSQLHTSFQEYCDKEVSSLGTCAEGLVFPAITKALGISMRIVSVGSGKQANQSASYDFPREGPCQAHLLFKPGHYDVLFPDPSSAWSSFTASALLEVSDRSVLLPSAESSANTLSIGVAPRGWGNSLSGHCRSFAPAPTPPRRWERGPILGRHIRADDSPLCL